MGPWAGRRRGASWWRRLRGGKGDATMRPQAEAAASHGTTAFSSVAVAGLATIPHPPSFVGPRRGCPPQCPPGPLSGIDIPLQAPAKSQADTFWHHLWISCRRLLRTPLPILRSFKALLYCVLPLFLCWEASVSPTVIIQKYEFQCNCTNP